MLKITTSGAPAPLRTILYGQEGVGKTTWAAALEEDGSRSGDAPLFLTCEEGSGDLELAQVVCLTWTDLRDAVRSILASPPEGFRKICVDTINGMERLCIDHICRRAKVDSIEDVNGGYGKGYTAVAEEMFALRQDFDAIRSKHKMHIIMLGHAHVRLFNDPNGPGFDRYEPRMNQKVAAIWLEWADIVLFACFEATVQGGKRGAIVDDPMKKGKATGGKRVVYTTQDATFIAKNRYGLPEEIPLSWGAFAKAMEWARREKEILPPTVDAVAAALVARLPGATSEEALTLAERIIAAVEGNMPRALNAAKAGIPQAKLDERLAALRAETPKEAE